MSRNEDLGLGRHTPQNGQEVGPAGPTALERSAPASQPVSYRDSDHSYWRGPERIPSVTQILSAMGGYEDVDRGVLANAAARGTKVHHACEQFDEWSLDESALDPEVAGYVRGWIRFREDTGFRPIEVEKLVHHKTLHYAGTLDRIGVFPGSGSPAMPWVLDIKSSYKLMPSYGPQLAGYAHCLDVPASYRRGVVHLHKDGSYLLHEYRGQQDWEIFQACLAIYRFKEANG